MENEDFPLLAAYLADLPDGLASYPECQAKASLLRGLLALRPTRTGFSHAPPELVQLLLDQPAPSAWIPEVHFVAIHFLISDAESIGVDAMLDWTYRANRNLTSSRMYRTLARVGSPGMLLRGAAASWRLIHRGTKLSVKVDGPRARLLLEHPPHLYTDLAHRSAGLGFQAVLEAAGAKQVCVDLERVRSGSAEFVASWS